MPTLVLGSRLYGPAHGCPCFDISTRRGWVGMAPQLGRSCFRAGELFEFVDGRDDAALFAIARRTGRALGIIICRRFGIAAVAAAGTRRHGVVSHDDAAAIGAFGDARFIDVFV